MQAFLYLFILSLFIFLPQGSRAADINVDCSVDDLQVALDSAASGDHIIIAAGTCNGVYDVPSAVNTIQGAGAGLTIINGTDPNSPAISVSFVNYLRIVDLTITGGSTGVAALYVNQLRLENCEVTGVAGTAISLNRRVGARIRNCNVHDNDNTGVSSLRGSFVEIRDFSGNPTMIQDNGGNGVVVHDGSSADIRENTVISGNGSDGISLDNGGSARVSDNTLVDSNGLNGLSIENGGSARVEDNASITNNGLSGVFLNHASNVRLDGATVTGNNTLSSQGSGGVGVFHGSVLNSTNSSISNNTRFGVGAFRNSTAFFTGSDVSNNTLNGIGAAQDSVLRFAGGDNFVQNNGNVGIICVDTSSRSGNVPDGNVTGNAGGDIICP